ncbi:unnamed protein product [Phaedon cochleariae]|uniref:Uncharacterized protein n=1 Tax=Phaedon cochleariae TaxID=80249 RepID=A0A9N9X478_PHACE|nr:unnamed protein product [Phaedon cochleariae]
MSGKVKGAQAVVQKRCPKAVYVHCASQSLNLAMANAAEVRSIRNCFGTTDDASLSADAESESEISDPPDQITDLCSGLKLISDAVISISKGHVFQDPEDLPAKAEVVENYAIEVVNENI